MSAQPDRFPAPARPVDPAVNGFDPSEIVRDFDWGNTRRLASGRTLREWEIVGQDRELELMPGVTFGSWTYNGRVPGPTLRARAGERLRVRFINGSSHPHTMHFHGIHTDVNDGIPQVGPGNIGPGESFVYEFDAEPVGFHHYHCHTSPLAEHIAKGLYGVFIVDPADGRAEADELVLVQSGFDTNFDRRNEMYAFNGIPFAYLQRPIGVRVGELIRIYALNITEYDLLNGLRFEDVEVERFPTGTRPEASELTSLVRQGQGERDVLELRFERPGRYRFESFVSGFAERGAVGLFDVR